MPTTLDSLTEEILANFQGYSTSPDQVTALTAAVSATDLSIPLASVETGLGTGMVEIGDELLYASAVDPDTGALKILPKGRGWRGTTAVPHDIGDTVVVSPLVPRYRVKAAINDVLNAVWPNLFGVTTYTFTYDSGYTAGWAIPPDVEMVLAVRYQDSLGEWRDVTSWGVVHGLGVGSLLRITGSVLIGSTVEVVYGKRPAPFASGSSLLSETGLSESAKDILMYGAMVRLVPALDVGRLGVQYVPADELDQPRQLGSAMALAREFQNVYTAALQKEQLYLQNRYPARVHRVVRV